MSPDPAPPPQTDGRQLHGWKEISAHFGRSVRTVQRWERDFGLPIRRYGLGRGEVVHAYVRELDDWRATAEAEAARRAAEAAADANGTTPNGDDPSHDAQCHHDGSPGEAPPSAVADPGPDELRGAEAGLATDWKRLPWSPPVRGIAAAAAFAAVAAIAALAGFGARDAWHGTGDPAETGRGTRVPEPADWTASSHRLTATDAEGRALWTHDFRFALRPRSPGSQDHYAPDQWSIDDLDGDGSRELLLVSQPADASKSDLGFYCFDRGGTLRWSFAYTGSQVFGDMPYGPPFKAERMFLTPRPRPGRDVWLVSNHSPWFPSVMSRMEPDGSVSAEFWSSGYIEAVRPAELDGRAVLLVAARNDESGGASLAVLDAAHPQGSAPAETPRYQCRSCPAGRPLFFVKIPKPARLQALRGSSPPAHLDVIEGRRVIVRVDHTRDISDTPGGFVVYTFDSRLRPLSVGLGTNFEAACRAVASKGYVPPLPASPVIEEVRTVRWWDGNRFIDLKAPAPAAPAGSAR